MRLQHSSPLRADGMRLCSRIVLAARISTHEFTGLLREKAGKTGRFRVFCRQMDTANGALSKGYPRPFQADLRPIHRGSTRFGDDLAHAVERRSAIGDNAPRALCGARMSQPLEQFVSEPLYPRAGTFDAAAMSRGEPGLPHQFTWRKREHAVVQVLRVWKTSGRERGGSEIYLRRHWYEILTDTGLRMSIYCERQARSAKRARARWWVFTVTGPPRLGEG